VKGRKTPSGLGMVPFRATAAMGAQPTLLSNAQMDKVTGGAVGPGFVTVTKDTPSIDHTGMPVSNDRTVTYFNSPFPGIAVIEAFVALDP